MRLDGVAGVSEIVGSHALKDGGCGMLGGDAVRELYEAIDGSDGELGVGAGNAAPGDTVSELEGAGQSVLDGRPERNDRARGLLPEGVGKRGGVAAFAEVGVDEVDARGFDVN